MSTSIKLNNDMYWDASAVYSPIKTASWQVSSTSAITQNLTETLTLTKGIWLVTAHLPTVSVGGGSYIIHRSSGTITSDGKWTYVNSDGAYSEIVEVTSDTATIVLWNGFSASTTYSNTDRGYLRAVKLSS